MRVPETTPAKLPQPLLHAKAAVEWEGLGLRAANRGMADGIIVGLV